MTRKVIIIFSLYIFNFCFGLTGAKYLIITPDNFVTAVQPLADWKTKKGVKAKIVPLSVTGNTASQIKSYIVNAYNTWQIRPKYILLAGLSSVLPTSGPSDDFYADMSGGYRIELSIGRLPCQTIDQCRNIVTKTLTYEHTPYTTDTSWFLKGTTIVREDGSSSSDPIYWENARYIHTCWRRVPYLQIDSFSYQRGHTSTDVTNAINNGRMFVIYRGQGVANWWSPFAITPENLSNGYKTPIVVSGTCQTMSLSDNNYLGNLFLNAGSVTTSKGAVGYFGTTEVGSGIAAQRGAATKGFFKAIFEERTYCMGDAARRGKFILDSIYNNQQPRYEEWNLFGDPELNIWTATPKPIFVTHDTIIGTIPQIYTITVNYAAGPCVNAQVCLMKDTTIYETAFTNALGIATFNINPPISGIMSVTVTGNNLIPHEKNVLIRPDSLAHDVGIMNYIQPQGIVAVGTNIVPQVKVKNYTYSTDTFPVSFIIGSVYNQTLSSIILGPGDTTTLSFPNWTAVGGNHTIIVYTTLNSDQYRANDTAHSSVNVVVPNDVGVDSILLPPLSHIINMVMTPKVRIENYGSTNQTNFPVICSIIGTGHVTRYSNTQNVMSLNAGDTLTIAFTSWTPTIAELCTVVVRTELIADSVPANDRKISTTTIVIMYLEDFEATNGSYVADPATGAWEWGVPTYTSGPSAYSGTKCWGTVLAGAYAASANWKLTSRLFVATANNPMIVFMHWYQMEATYDGGNVKYSTDGTNWTLLTPTVDPYNGTGYTGTGIAGEACWTGTSVGNNWHPAAFVVPVNSGQSFWIRWHFGTDASVQYAGWYIDDVTGTGFLPLSIEEEINKTITISSTQLYAPNPNPATNGLAHISFSIAEPTRASLKIYDASGRVVKTLMNNKLNVGNYNLTWNGTDEHHDNVAEGIYFYTLTTDNNNYTKKLVFTR